jgi:predicted ATPase
MEVAKYVLTGPMRSGKSSLIQAISKKIRIFSMNEVAQFLINGESRKPESEQIVPWNKKKFYEFQKKVFDLQSQWEKENDRDCIKYGFDKVIMDRSIIDGLAYLMKEGYEKSELYNRVHEAAQKKRYEKVFICEFISNEISDEKRKDIEDYKRIENFLSGVYITLGYSPISIPKYYNPNETKGLSEDEKKLVKDRAIEKRADLILKYINN